MAGFALVEGIKTGCPKIIALNVDHESYLSWTAKRAIILAQPVSPCVIPLNQLPLIGGFMTGPLIVSLSHSQTHTKIHKHTLCIQKSFLDLQNYSGFSNT